jgi:hypothetical protein
MSRMHRQVQKRIETQADLSSPGVYLSLCERPVFVDGTDLFVTSLTSKKQTADLRPPLAISLTYWIIDPGSREVCWSHQTVSKRAMP